MEDQFLDNLDARAEFDVTRTGRCDDGLAWRPQRMSATDGVGEYGGVDENGQAAPRSLPRSRSPSAVLESGQSSPGEASESADAISR